MATQLFGPSPLALQQAQQANLQERASQYAQLNPLQRASQSLYQAGSNLGGGIAGLMGVQDPAMKRQSDIAAIVSKYDIANPEDLQKASKELMDAGFQQEASLAIGKANELAKAQADIEQVQAKTQQEAAAAKAAAYKVSQDEELRTKLSELPAESTQDDMLKVVMKYGSPDKVLQVVQIAADKQAARDQAAQLQKERIQAKLEADLRDAKNEKERDAFKAESRKELAQFTSALKTGTQATKPLSPGLQKDEMSDLAAIDTYTAQQEALAPSIQNLTPDAKGVRKLELGPLKNAEYAARNAAGKSTPESRAYEALKSAYDTAVNLQVSAEKGVQTDKDVLRFAQALIAAYGRNDTQATLEAVKRYTAAIAKASERTQGRVEARRKAQNVEPYGFSSKPAAGTTENPIKLD